MFFFFFSSRRRHTRLQGDWSSDVCSSDLAREWGRSGSASVAPEPAGEVRDEPRGAVERGDDLAHPFGVGASIARSEEHTSELQSPCNLVCRLLLEKKKKKTSTPQTFNTRATYGDP